MPEMCAIPQLVSAQLNPIPIVEHFRRSHSRCEHSYRQSIWVGKRQRKSQIARDKKQRRPISLEEQHETLDKMRNGSGHRGWNKMSGSDKITWTATQTKFPPQNGYNIVSTLQRCVGLKIVVANHLLNRGLKIGVFGHFWRTVNVKKSRD